MECTSKKIVNVTLTENEAEDLKEEMLYLLRDYSGANKLKVINTLNNVISVELTRLANN